MGSEMCIRDSSGGTACHQVGLQFTAICSTRTDSVSLRSCGVDEKCSLYSWTSSYLPFFLSLLCLSVPPSSGVFTFLFSDYFIFFRACLTNAHCMDNDSGWILGGSADVRQSINQNSIYLYNTYSRLELAAYRK